MRIVRANWRLLIVAAVLECFFWLGFYATPLDVDVPGWSRLFILWTNISIVIHYPFFITRGAFPSALAAGLALTWGFTVSLLIVWTVTGLTRAILKR